jgi:hypothetical protein
MSIQIGYKSPSFYLPPDQVVSWLKADAGITLSGSYVTKWDDQSGNDNYVYNISASYAPLYVPAYSGSYPAVLFDGVDDRLDFRTLLIGGTADTVVFAVCRPLFTGVNLGLIGSTSYRYFQYISNRVSIQGGSSGTNAILTKTIPTDTFHVAALAMTNRTGSFYLNNVDVTLQQLLLGNVGQIKYIGAGAVIGMPQSPFYGPVSELIIVSGTLPPDVISNVNQSLIDKYRFIL